MSDWTREYVPDAANVVGGLTQKQIDDLESLASFTRAHSASFTCILRHRFANV